MRLYLKHPKAKTSLVYCEDNGRRVSTGITVPTKYWDAKNRRVTRRHPNYKAINSSLKNFVPPKRKEGTLLLFYYKWATKGTASKTTPRRGDLYSYNLFKEYAGEDISYDDIDYSFYDGFLSFLQDKGLAANTQGSHISRLKAVMNEAFKLGLHTNLAYKNFKKPSEEVDAPYLTDEELDKLRNLELYGRPAKVRDLFLIGCRTGMRFSDYSRLSSDWFENGEIHFISTKTSARQVIPLAEEVKNIVQKYNGQAPCVNQVAFNRIIKEICKEAEIDTPVHIEKVVGKEKVVSVMPKYKLVSSHTARRTAASLLIKAGAPVAWVMSLTGHKTEAAFWKYVRLSRDDYSKLLKDFIR